MWYRVMLKGENFVMKLSGKQTVHGFYTTRYVEATSEDDAEMKAVELIREDNYLRERVRNPKSDLPMIYLKEIEMLASHSGEAGSGYTFYSDDD